MNDLSARPAAPTRYRCGAIAIDADLRQVLVDGEPAKLGARAFDVLLALVERRDRIVSKRELLTLAWHGLVVEENNLQVQVVALRKLFGPQAIATVPGRGYRFTLLVEGAPAAPSESRPAQPAPAEAAPRTNLAREIAPLYGRERDLAAVAARLAEHRLVTIVGAGGIGKTRLAQAVAAQHVGRGADGVWFVELAPITNPALVAQAVAAALGLGLGPGESAAELVERLAPHETLIVIDNCEHLIDVVSAFVERLVATAPRVRVLATSQELLKVAGESVYRLETLSVPDATAGDDIAACGAVQLFVERVRAQMPGFAVQPNNRQAIGDICRRLDGLPLALELAAARVPVLGIDGLRQHLGERFRVLTGGARMALRKHQTLRAALDWSHGLLSADERIVFRRLGVFAGGFTLELAQLVTADERIDGWAVLELLAHLVEKSLVIAEGGDAGGVPRYGLLETTRAFALEQLAAAGESDALMRRHAHAMRDLIDTVGRRRWTLSQAESQSAVRELGNLRAALDWASAEGGDRMLAIDALSNSAIAWMRGALVTEGIERMMKLLPLPPDVGARREADFCLSLARLGNLFGRDEYWNAAQRAAALYRQLGDKDGRADALMPLAMIAALRGDTVAADQALREAEQLIGDSAPANRRASLAVAHGLCANARGDYAQAVAAFQRQAMAYRTGGEFVGEYIALGNEGWSRMADGDLDRAIEVLNETVAGLRRTGGLHALGPPLGNLAVALASRGDDRDVLLLAREAYGHLRSHGHRDAPFFAAAAYHANRGALQRALLLAGYLRALRAALLPVRTDPVGLQREARIVQAAGDGGFSADDIEALLVRGSRITELQAVGLAFEGASPEGIG